MRDWLFWLSSLYSPYGPGYVREAEDLFPRRLVSALQRRRDNLMSAESLYTEQLDELIRRSEELFPERSDDRAREVLACR